MSRTDPLRFAVTATDTGVGKTSASMALLSLLVKRGERPFAFKPYESGLTPGAESDSEKLWRAAGQWQPKETVCLHRFREPVAPGIAARRESRSPSWALTVKTFKTFTGPGVVEGAGGLHVPLDSRHDVIDLLRAVQLPVIVIARAGLGTINHSTLTLNALLAAGLHPVALVLNHATPGKPDASVRDNRAELQRRFTRVPILGPVPFQARESARTRAFEQVLTELIENRLRR